MYLLPANRFDDLLDALRAEGYQPIGPVVRDGAIVYRRLDSAGELPRGWGDEQAPGRYRLRARGDNALFGYVVGPDTWKYHLVPPDETAFRAVRREDGGLEFRKVAEEPPKRALIGVRACELAALAIHDTVFASGPNPREGYRQARENAFIVAVGCSTPADTCFCTSMGQGPRPERGYDLNLTEVLDADRHLFTVEAGSDHGAAIVERLGLAPAGDGEAAASRQVTDAAAAAIERRMPDNVATAIKARPEHPRWSEVAERCLACGNCTQVCPTCFCTRNEELTVLDEQQAEQHRVWDSCFNRDFSYLAGGHVIRDSVRSRYRQWLTHKLSTWYDQFGSSGCTGCGRCLTWCPVGIDITEEAAAIAADES